MDIRDALLNRRSIRKFEQKRIPEKDLEMLIDYARIAATGANLQPLKFVLVEREELLGQVFSCTKWAGYLPEAAPQPGEEPMAYIAILTDRSIKENAETEAGAAIMSMMLGAMDFGLGSCWLGAIDRKKLLSLFKLSGEEYTLNYLLALGYPAQKSEITDYAGDVRYFMGENQTVRVPKRSLEDVLIRR